MGKLILVPTPIGNLEDITLRALRVLKEVDLILAEDTRTSGKLLKHYEISTPMQSYHMHNEHNVLESILRKIETGQNLVLISDAGTPGISDPGFLLVRACLERQLEVECLPGATALIPALVSSGLPSDKFVFEGFLPVKKGRKTRLEFLSQETRTMIFYESPHKLVRTLQDFSHTFGNERIISLSRELTKLHEETLRGSIDTILQIVEHKSLKGEIVLVVAGKSTK